MKKLIELIKKLLGMSGSSDSSSSSDSSEKGFTLIELLIVIAILGILAAGVLLAVDPIEQLKRGNDSNRLSSVRALGESVQSYYTNVSPNTFPAVSSTWQDPIVTAGDLAAKINVSEASSNCTTNKYGGVCYTITSGYAFVWTILESGKEKTRAGCTATQVASAVYDSSQAKTGVGCLATATTVPTAGISLK